METFAARLSLLLLLFRTRDGSAEFLFQSTMITCLRRRLERQLCVA